MVGRFWRSAGRVDRRVVRRVAALPRTPVDRGLWSLTRSANHGVLWFAIATLLAARRGATRRAALRGTVAVAGASASANLVGKRLFPRRRPAADLLPPYRRLPNRPSSTSFPSGHAASAAAFTTAVAMEHPVAAAAIAPLAATVAYSRVHTGVHWPSDVATGAVLGVGAALATRRWWPVHPDAPATTFRTAEAPAIDTGAGLLIVVNPRSGDDIDPIPEITATWPDATVIRPKPGIDLVDAVSDVIDTATGDVLALGVAGGDGTVAAVASVAAERRLPLAVVPTGTLNHFARDIGVHSVSDAAGAMRARSAVRVDLAGVDVADGSAGTHRWFVNTASLGGYPELVRMRDKLEARWGRWPSALLALVRVLRRAEPLPVVIDGRPALVWMVFVGSSPYTPKGFVPTRRPAMDTGMLDVRYLRADIAYSRARFVLAALARTLAASRVYREREAAVVEVRLRHGRTRVAVDGEVGPLGRRFVFRSRLAALTVYRPGPPDGLA